MSYLRASQPLLKRLRILTQAVSEAEAANDPRRLQQAVAKRNALLRKLRIVATRRAV
jgi:hypothetical protein